MRFGCDGRDAATIYFDLHQRTLRYEVYFLPDPPAHHEELYRFLLQRNHTTYGAHFSIGPDGDCYLVGRVLLEHLDVDELDRIIGVLYELVERWFQPAIRHRLPAQRPRPEHRRKECLKLSCSALGSARATVRRVDGPEVREGGPVRGSAGRSEGSSGPTRRCVAASVARLAPRSRYPRARCRASRCSAAGRWAPRCVGGLLDGGWDADDARRSPRSTPTAGATSKQQFPKVRVVPSAAWAVADADVVIVAVKPGDVAGDARSRAAGARRSDALVLSIAAGVTIATLEALAPGRPVVRAMPNTPALVGLGASAIAPGAHATEPHLELAERLLGAVGIVVRVDETALDAVTGLSGSGPAYVFLVAEAMIEAGVLVGLPATIAEQLVDADAARLGDAARAERRRPGSAARRGDVAGRHDRGRPARARGAGVRAAILDAVAAATRRSQELGREGRRRPWTERGSNVKARNRPPRASTQRHAAPPPAPPPSSADDRGTLRAGSIAGKVDEPRPARAAAPGREARREPGRGVGRDPAVFGATIEESQIDPAARLARARVAGTRIGAVARAGGRIAFATAQPASLLSLQTALARRARAVRRVDRRRRRRGPDPRRRPRPRRFLRWIDGVAVVTDGASRARDDRAGRGRGVDVPRPAARLLVVADGPFALAAVARRRRGGRLRRARSGRSRHPRAARR